jgi:putative selenium metabolism protein SsnA
MPYSLDPPANFIQILQRVWWRLDRALDRDSVRASALAAGLDAVLAGTTTIIDHHASPNAIDGSLDVIADTLEEIGVRSVLCYEVTDRDGPERAEAGIEENRRFLKSSRALTAGMVGAHASFTLSEDTLAACVDVAQVAGAGVHIHVAEDAADQADAQARFGRRVVHRLAEAGALGERSLLAHCIHMAPHEAAVIRDSGATPVHNPRSNMNNAVGNAPIDVLGGRVGLGTDGIDGDMFAESVAGYWRARESHVAPGADWALQRLAESSRFAGSLLEEPLLGRIEPGAPADLVVLEYDPPTPLTEDNVAWHWVFGLSARKVRDVVVAGDVVVSGREPTRIAQGEAASTCRAEAARLWARLDEVDVHPFEPEGAA